MDAHRRRRFKHVFLDAEGTLYVPRNGRSRWEFWADPSPESALEFFELDEGVVEALTELRGSVETLCLVSMNNRTILYALLEKFGILDFFDDILMNGDKGKKIDHYLWERGLRKEEAVMVGDMPVLDLYPVRAAGIEAILVDRGYNRAARAERIQGIKDLPCWLRVADLAETIANVQTTTLDDFLLDPSGRVDTPAADICTKSLIHPPAPEVVAMHQISTGRAP